MADGFIVRKGGVATEQALAPTITQVATTETSITFTITNNDAETAIIRHRLDDITDEGVIVELATNATSANITISDLDDDTTFTVFATANVTGKVKSNVTQLAISTNQIPAPTITLVSKTTDSITFTLTNNSVEERNVTFGLTTPPTTTTITLASQATSGNQTFSNLDDDTTFTIFAQAADGVIGQLSITTDPPNPFTTATGGTTAEYDDGGKRYRSHTFTSSGTFTVTNVGEVTDDRNKVDYLIIAGGGAGNYEGGAGAGGYQTTNGLSGASSSALPKVTVTETAHTITVGLGATSTAPNTPAVNGFNSSGLGITSLGGGGGGGNSSFDNPTSGTGGSGGGGGANQNGAPGTAGQGTNGARGGNPAGGGGGAGTAASASISTLGGNGGNGLGNILRTGSSETRGGGGGGGVSSGSTSGGTGGGGAGGGTGSPGAANTGGGGGGSWNVAGANGGSGIVVIRYEIAPSV